MAVLSISFRSEMHKFEKVRAINTSETVSARNKWMPTWSNKTKIKGLTISRHLTDSQSFPYDAPSIPELAATGAYSKQWVLPNLPAVFCNPIPVTGRKVKQEKSVISSFLKIPRPNQDMTKSSIALDRFIGGHSIAPKTTKRQGRKRQSVTAKREKSRTPKFV